MIGLSGTVRVMMATKPVDFRKGMEGLAMLVREHMKADPFSGAVYVFRAKRADRIVIRPFNCGLLSSSHFRTLQRQGGSARAVGAGRGCGDGAGAADTCSAGRALDRLMSSPGSWSFPRSRSAS